MRLSEYRRVIRISCRGRLQDICTARNQYGGPGKLHPLFRWLRGPLPENLAKFLLFLKRKLMLMPHPEISFGAMLFQQPLRF